MLPQSFRHAAALSAAILLLFSFIIASARNSFADDPASFQDDIYPTSTYDGTRDTYIDSANPNANYGADSPLLLDGDPADYGAVIKWDLSAGSLPVDTKVFLATLTFYVINQSSQTYRIYEMKRDWEEMEATWNIYSTGNSWETAGAQGANDVGAQAGSILASSIDVYKTVALNSTGTTLVQSWIDNPAANYGLALETYTNTDGLDISSRESGTTARHPKLKIFTSLYPYLQQVTQSSVIVMWETRSACIGTVEYGLTGSYGSSKSESAAATIHEVQLTALAADTLYHYRVVADGITSEEGTFRTSPSSDGAFTFLAYGDNRGTSTYDYVTDHEAIIDAMAANDPHTMILNVGDVVYSGAASEYQPQLFLPGRRIFKNNTLYIVTGNHEGNSDPARTNLKAYVQPASGTINQLYYSFNYGNTHFAAINNYEDYTVGSAQYNWLSADLDSVQATSAKWIVVFEHVPAYSSGSHGPDANVIANILPLLESKGVDMFIVGHDHFYERSYKDGVYHLIVGGGGAPLSDVNVNANAYKEYNKKTLSYALISPGSDKITVKAYDSSGNNFDNFFVPRETDVSVPSGGGPSGNLKRDTTDNLLGTFYLSSGGTISALTVTQYGTCTGATAFQNVKLFQDDGDGVWEPASDTTQLGATTNFDASEEATFNGFTLSAGPTTYVHVIVDVTTSPTIGQTGGVEIHEAADVTSTATVAAASWPVQAGLAFIDPFGIVFDSVTNNPIPGAVVTLYYQLGGNYIVARPGIEIGAGEQNPQTTDANGFYQYTVVFPPATNLQLSVTAAGYAFPTTKPIASFPTRTFDDAAGAIGQPFAFAGVIQHIDLPMDPQGNLLNVRKDANKKEVNVGDIVTYTVTITNPTAADVTNVLLEDKIPAGFKYLSGKCRLDGAPMQDPTGTRPIVFDIGTVSSGATRTLSYQLIVGSGVTFQKYQNTVFAKYADQTVISNVTSETVRVVPDPLFDLSIAIGKVFWDWDEDGAQDGPRKDGGALESGLSGVRIVMEDGTVIITDEEGRYHVPKVTPGRHAFRLDESTLPEGAYVTTGKVAIVDMRAGLTSKINFGISTSDGRLDPSGILRDKLRKPLDETPGLKRLPISIIQEKSALKPRLNVALNKNILRLDNNGSVIEPGIFRVFTNYSLFIDKWRLEIYERSTGRIFKHFEGDGASIGLPIVWDGTSDKGSLLEEDREYLYRVTAWDKDHRFDRTKARSFKALKEESLGSKDALEIKLFGKKSEPSGPEVWERERRSNGLESRGILINGESIIVKGAPNETDAKAQGDNVPGKSEITVRLVETGSVSLPASLELSASSDIRSYSEEIIVPNGSYTVSVEAKDAAGQTLSSIKDVKTGDDSYFFIAMGDGEAGYNFRTGNTEPVNKDDRFKQGFWVGGKLAYYLKAKIKGKYLITSSLDTQRKEKELFRYIDPDKYYPVYGDNSSISYDATNSQGMLYAMVEWDRSRLIWGNYEATLDDTEFAKFSRTLYGAKADLISVSDNKFGEPNTKVMIFMAKAQQRSAHNEFLGTGGSLYYMRHKYIIDGSDKIRIEVRDKITGLVLGSIEQREGSDYQIDYDNGRIIFWKPISQIVQSDSIISSHLLDGDKLYVVADYEYEVKDKYDEMSKGLRVSQQLGDYVRLGGTYLEDNQEASKNFKLGGTDATVRLGKDTKIDAEYAESRAKTGNNFISTDGGITFTELVVDEMSKGRAYGLKGESRFTDLIGLSGYYKRVERGFSSPFVIFDQGTEKIGAEVVLDVIPGARLSARHDIQTLISDGNLEARSQIGANRTETTTAQLKAQLTKKVEATAEYRHQMVREKREEYEAETNTKSDIVAGRIIYKPKDNLKLSLAHQEPVSGPGQRQTTLGAESRLNDYITIRASETVAPKGNATTVGGGVNVKDRLDLFGDYTVDNSFGILGDTISVGTRANIDERSSVYNTYSVNNSTASGKRETVSMGTKKKVNDAYEVAMGKEFSKDALGLASANTYEVTADRDGRAVSGKFKQQLGDNNGNISNSNIFALTGELNDRLAINFDMENGKVQNIDGSETNRLAVGGGANYADKDRVKASSKLEFRLDSGGNDARQVLSYNSIEGKVGRDLTIFGKANISHTKNTGSNTALADFKEMVLGAAYRPVYFDKLNLIGKYTFLEDLAPVSQQDFKNIEHIRSHVFAIDAIYDFTDNVQIVEKAAMKSSEEKVAGFGFTKSEKWLLVNRLNYNFMRDWQAAGEYRFLSVIQAKDLRHGALFEVSRKIGDTVRVGAGYNFTDFSDDLTELDYTVHGPFLRFTGTMYDRTKEEIARSKKLEAEYKTKRWARGYIDEVLAKPGSPRMKELYGYFASGLEAYNKGRLSEARDWYVKILDSGDSLYGQAYDHVSQRVSFENRLKEYKTLADIYYKEGKLKESKELWEKIISELGKEGYR